MYKKYKIKKRKKIINPYYIFLIFAIFILFLSSSYALLSDNLSISGKANILVSDTNIYGNSTYYWNLFTDWIGSDGISHYYQVNFPITNLDGDAQSWEISFDVPSGCDITSTDIWQASEITIIDNTITLKSQDWAGLLNNGDTLSLNFILQFETEVNFDITNVILNGKYVNFVLQS